MAAATQAPLLSKLSAELRNRIYELALISSTDIDISSEQQPGLICTCRQIREESIKMYYNGNTFGFITCTGNSTGLRGIEQWLQRIGTVHCTYLSSIRVQIGVANGLIITADTAEENPWTRLVQFIGAMRCSPNIELSVFMHRDEPVKEDFHISRTAQRLTDAEKQPECWHTLLDDTMNDYLRSVAMKLIGRAHDERYRLACDGGWNLVRIEGYNLTSIEALLYADRPNLEEEERHSQAIREYSSFTMAWIPGEGAQALAALSPRANAWINSQ